MSPAEWAIFTSSTWSAIPPSRRPRSRSEQKGEPPTGASTGLAPPMVTARSGLRGSSANEAGAEATISITNSLSHRTRSPSTSWPLARSRASTSSWRTSVPISSMIVIARSCTASTSSGARIEIASTAATVPAPPPAPSGEREGDRAAPGRAARPARDQAVLAVAVVAAARGARPDQFGPALALDPEHAPAGMGGIARTGAVDGIVDRLRQPPERPALIAARDPLHHDVFTAGDEIASAFEHASMVPSVRERGDRAARLRRRGAEGRVRVSARSGSPSAVGRDDRPGPAGGRDRAGRRRAPAPARPPHGPVVGGRVHRARDAAAL